MTGGPPSSPPRVPSSWSRPTACFAQEEEVGDPDLVEDVLDRIWEGLTDPSGSSGTPNADRTLPGRDEILDLLPNPQEDVNSWSFCAESAIAVLAQAVLLGAGGPAAGADAGAGPPMRRWTQSSPTVSTHRG